MSQFIVICVHGEWYSIAVRREDERGFIARVWLGVPTETSDGDSPFWHRGEDRFAAAAGCFAWCYRRASLGSGAVN